jgi:hypothetical protein
LADNIWRELSPGKLLKCVDLTPRVLIAIIEAEGDYCDEKYAPKKYKHQVVY